MRILEHALKKEREKAKASTIDGHADDKKDEKEMKEPSRPPTKRW